MTAHTERPPAGTPGAPPAPVPTDSAMSLVSAFGGVRGMIDMTLPGLVFVVAFTITRSTWASSWTAVAVAGVLTAVRLLRREGLQHAVGGFLGVAVAAWVAVKSGKAENFYLLGLLMSGGYALAYLVSIAVRWPLIGVVLGPVLGENFAWRNNPGRYAAYKKATWVWVALFVLRIVVQLPIYWSGNVTALGVAKIALGVPPWLVAIYLTWLIMSKAPPPVREEEAESAEETEPETGPGHETREAEARGGQGVSGAHEGKGARGDFGTD